MRELTKSLASFSWAMSLFGVKQLARVMRPAEASDAFDTVSHTTQRHLDGVFLSAFQVGDRMQRSMVDITFGLLGLGGASPGRWAGTAAEAAERAAGSMAGGLRNAAWSGSPESNAGWGPMPHREPPPSSPGAAAERSAAIPVAAASGGWGPVPAERG